jgi:hypothetical protein
MPVGPHGVRDPKGKHEQPGINQPMDTRTDLSLPAKHGFNN